MRTEVLRLRAALHDPVTGLSAYPALLSRLRTLLDEHRHVGVLHVGVDDVELVEALYGWQVLDGLLARVADELRAAAREALPAGTLLSIDRVAGDRFLAFVPATPTGEDPDSPYLAELCEVLRSRLDRVLEDDAFYGLGPRLAFRIGHALLSENPYYRFERRVHAAVAEAGELPDRVRSRREVSVEEELRRIVEQCEVRATLHPIVDLVSGREIAYEALARGPRGSRFELPASMFAESARVGIETALDRACRAAAFRERERVDGETLLFVNALAASLEDPEWRGEPVASQMQAAHTDAGHVVIEVSERGLDVDPERTCRAVDGLRASGFRISLDDVGTGYASLETLERLRPDFVKIDPSLVRAIDRHEIKQEAVGSLVHIVSTLGADLIAEGVETREEAETLRRIGIRLAQGYLFRRPAETGSRGATP